MLMIRFQRIGRKNDASFRIAVLEKASGPKAGKYVDLVGTYNPKTKATTLKPEAIHDWIKKGAQVSPTVMNLLIKNDVLEGKKVAVISKTTLEKHIAKRKAEEEAAAAKVKEDADKAAAKEAAEKEVAEKEAAEKVEAPAEVVPEADAVPAESPTEPADAEPVAA